MADQDHLSLILESPDSETHLTRFMVSLRYNLVGNSQKVETYSTHFIVF